MPPQPSTAIPLPLTPEVAAALVAERCYVDAGFRNRMLENPKEALRELYRERHGKDADIPWDDLNIVIRKNTDNTWYVPTRIPDATEETVIAKAGAAIASALLSAEEVQQGVAIETQGLSENS